MEKNSEERMETHSNEKSRREFLKAAAALGVYTPPAIMMLLKPSREALACNSLRPQGNSFHQTHFQWSFFRDWWRTWFR